jgi:hypothetical protein
VSEQPNRREYERVEARARKFASYQNRQGDGSIPGRPTLRALVGEIDRLRAALAQANGRGTEPCETYPGSDCRACGLDRAAWCAACQQRVASPAAPAEAPPDDCPVARFIAGHLPRRTLREWRSWLARRIDAIPGSHGPLNATYAVLGELLEPTRRADATDDASRDAELERERDAARYERNHLSLGLQAAEAQVRALDAPVMAVAPCAAGSGTSAACTEASIATVHHPAEGELRACGPHAIRWAHRLARVSSDSEPDAYVTLDRDLNTPRLQADADRLRRALRDIGFQLSAWITTALGPRPLGEEPLGEPVAGFVTRCAEMLGRINLLLVLAIQPTKDTGSIAEIGARQQAAYDARMQREHHAAGCTGFDACVIGCQCACHAGVASAIPLPAALASAATLLAEEIVRVEFAEQGGEGMRAITICGYTSWIGLAAEIETQAAEIRTRLAAKILAALTATGTDTTGEGSGE